MYGKLNYDALEEEFCYWYNKVNFKFPSNTTRFSKVNLVRNIHKLKREHKRLNKSLTSLKN
jgi:hypothetical protein